MTDQTDQSDLGIKVLQEHEKRLFQLIHTVLTSPINNYTDREGRPDRELISQQLVLRSTLVLSLSNQVGRLQLALYSLGVQNLGVDFGAIMNEMAEAQDDYECNMDSIHRRVESSLPIAPETVVGVTDGDPDDETVLADQTAAETMRQEDVTVSPFFGRKVGDGVYQG